MSSREPQRGVIGAIVATFLTGPPALLLIALAMALGAAAILLTPREEDPQIVVPLADVYVSFPGASPEEVEKLVATPLERLLWQVDGVEYVYSTSRRGGAVVTVRFFVGEDREDALVKLQNRIESHRDIVPSGVTGWVVRPVEIDDVPIVTLTLHGGRDGQQSDDYQLRRLGEELLARLESEADISRTRIVGGRRRRVRVELDPERMRGRGVTALEVARALRGADSSLAVGAFVRGDQHVEVTSGPFLAGVADVEALVVAAPRGLPVYVADIATVRDGPEEVASYSRIRFGPQAPEALRGREGPAVTLAVAKKRGTNAVDVADRVIARARSIGAAILPDGVELLVTRNTGATADAKVDELLASLLFAMVSVVVLLSFTLGWRESVIVALAVPISFSLALAVNYLTGYTINRVTLFALILSLGLVVDDPITNVDNIQRHIRMRRRRPLDATLDAVEEVLPPVIMSTLAIIASFLPLFFITGMMGPYMRPMAINVPLTVTFSTLAALTIVPWAAYHLLRRAGEASEEGDGVDVTPAWLRRGYARVVGPFVDRPALSVALIGFVGLLLAGSAALAATRRVPLKLLPFDDKNELQVVVDMPEGTTLERTDAAVRDLADALAGVNEVTDLTSYVGLASPMDFNGLVRHYYLRAEPHLADLRVNLAPKERRVQGSHEIALRIRPELERRAARWGAAVQIVETPPGPPVIATLVGEVYGAPDQTYDQLADAAGEVARRMAEEPGVVSVDTTLEAAHERLEFVVDKEKAALHGIDTGSIVETLRTVLSGATPARIHRPQERQPLVVELRFPRARRSGRSELERTSVKSASGELIELVELGRFEEVAEEQPIYHKNLERVVYVMAETAGRAPAEAVLDLQAGLVDRPLADGVRVEWSGEGEWKITLRVFRDLGLAFGAALLGIYLLIVLETRSFALPLVIMLAIPLTAIGILPGFWLLNLLVDRPIGPYANPVFFTATAMIGMIALGGIVVRNSIVLIDFIGEARAAGRPAREAILESGAVRIRPIVLTAMTTALGAWPITLDPIFSGLAWALIFGLGASTAFTLIVVPVVYARLYGTA